MKVVISGGGTGGHIYPAIAIADALREKDPTTQVLFIGAEGKMEMEKVPEAGYKIVGLTIRGIQRKLTFGNILKNLTLPFVLWKAESKAKSLLREFKPDVVVGVGGYASAPTLIAARSLGVPYLIQEQNGYAGFTNKKLAKNASKICVAYPGMSAYFPENKIVMTGNPVRKDIAKAFLSREEGLAHFGFDGSRPVVLVMGGSLGARSINEALLEGYEDLLDKGIQLIWQTGKGYFETLEKAVLRKESSLKLMPFIKRMDCAYACADVVVSRAGALSISELCLAEKASILVPSPNVAEDHQTKNAMALVKENAVILVKDEQSKEQLVGTLIDLVKNVARMEELEQNIAKLAKPNAAKEIVEELYKIKK